MNHYIKRIKQIDSQVKQLQKLIDRGDHIATGLKIDLGLGPNQDESISFEIAEYTENVLILLQESLLRSKEINLMWLNQERNEINGFFE